MGASASVHYGATSEEIVERFIDERISKVAFKLTENPKRGAVEEKFSSLHLDRIVSLKSFALKHHAKQQNSYIKPDVVSASFIRQKNTSQRNSSSTGSLKKSSPSFGSLLLDPIAETKPLATSTDALINKPKKKFNLKIQINDEDDWIQVSDEEGEDEASPRLRKQTLNHAPQQQSYILTQSGTIFVKGFGEGIAKCGIQEEGVDGAHRIPMKERLVILCKLGSGASSVVYKALDLGEMRLVAVKMISVYDRDKRRQMVRELSALFKMLRQRQSDVDTPPMHHSLVFERKALHAYLSRSMSSDVPETSSNKIYPHQYIVDFYDAFSNIEDGGVALMMEYMDGGSLQDVADAGGCQDEEVLANIALQVVAGLCALRHCNQIHRDIKPANLLINMLGDVKISDLGILRQIDPLEIANNTGVVATSATESGTMLVSSDGNGAASDSGIHRAHTFCGTATYMAPERIDGQDYSYSSDVWSVGLSLMTIALGRMPIESKGGFWALLSNIRDAPPPELPKDGHWSDDFRRFLARCLQHDPAKRATAFELLQDPFLSRARPDPPEGHRDREEAEAAAVKELKDIINAMHDHIIKLKEEQMKSSQANILVGLAESLTGNDSDKGFDPSQQASSLSAKDILYMLLFGDGSHAADTNNQSVDQFRSIRTPSRLHTLAQQLHINFNLAVATARETLIDLSNPEMQMRMMATPKAAQRM